MASPTATVVGFGPRHAGEGDRSGHYRLLISGTVRSSGQISGRSMVIVGQWWSSLSCHPSSHATAQMETSS
jgi:hypothetical protein